MSDSPWRILDRYELRQEFASGGMATIHFGRLLGAVGFTRTVAIKRLHAQFARDPAFVAMFVDEARVAACIHHPNVVGTLDVVSTDDELFLVMQYVPGEALGRLLAAAQAAQQHVPTGHCVAIVLGALHGLHAAHEATNAAGEALGVVHRDISPQNVLVGVDGVARIIDFGVAKAVERVHSTRDGAVHGKIRYMAPEQVRDDPIDRRADVYAAAVVLWEALAGRPYIQGDSPAAQVNAVLERQTEPPTAGAHPALDGVVTRGLARDPGARFSTALEMAAALERAMRPSSQREVAEWVSATAGDVLLARAEQLRRVEMRPSTPPGATPPGDDLDTRRRAGKPFVALGMPRDQVPLVTHFRSTLVVASIQALRANGLFDRYVAHLPESLHDEVASVPAGGWIAVELVMEHYRALERAQFDPTEVVALLRSSADTMKGYLWEMLGRLSRSAGLPLWNTIRRYGFLWRRVARGGGFEIWDMGPKEACIEVLGVPPLALPYFRQGFVQFHLAAARPFGTQATVSELVKHGTETSIVLRLSWV